MYTLTDEQKEQILAEVAHYLEMDCYDFGVAVGPFSLLAGELAKQAEEMMAELDGDYNEEEEDGIRVDGRSQQGGTALQNEAQQPTTGKRQTKKTGCRAEA